MLIYQVNRWSCWYADMTDVTLSCVKLLRLTFPRDLDPVRLPGTSVQLWLGSHGGLESLDILRLAPGNYHLGLWVAHCRARPGLN